jgi:hypothetical protein
MMKKTVYYTCALNHLPEDKPCLFGHIRGEEGTPCEKCNTTIISSTEKPSQWKPVKYPIEDWMYKVANGDTRLGYKEWLEHQIESNRR